MRIENCNKLFSVDLIAFRFSSFVSYVFAKELGWESSRVILENDTNAALLAEVRKTMHQCTDVLFLGSQLIELWQV